MTSTAATATEIDDRLLAQQPLWCPCTNGCTCHELMGSDDCYHAPADDGTLCECDGETLRSTIVQRYWYTKDGYWMDLDYKRTPGHPRDVLARLNAAAETGSFASITTDHPDDIAHTKLAGPGSIVGRYKQGGDGPQQIPNWALLDFCAAGHLSGSPACIAEGCEPGSSGHTYCGNVMTNLRYLDGRTGTITVQLDLHVQNIGSELFGRPGHGGFVPRGANTDDEDF